MIGIFITHQLKVVVTQSLEANGAEGKTLITGEELRKMNLQIMQIAQIRKIRQTTTR